MSEEHYEPRRYWSDRLEREFNPRGTGHISYSAGYNAWLYRAKRLALGRALKEVGNRGPALDIGSGTGWVVAELLRRGMVVEGSDIAPEAVSHLRRRFPDLTFFELELGAGSVPRGDGSYALITALDVLYHITDDEPWEAGIGEIARLLRPGGGVIVSDAFGDAELAPAPHVRLRSLRRWEVVAGRCGLRLKAMIPLYRWLSREHDASRLKRLPDGLRGALEFSLELAAPRKPHMRVAVLVRERESEHQDAASH